MTELGGLSKKNGEFYDGRKAFRANISVVIKMWSSCTLINLTMRTAFKP